MLQYYWNDDHIEIWYRALESNRQKALVRLKLYKRMHVFWVAHHTSECFWHWSELGGKTRKARKKQSRAQRHYKQRLQAAWFYVWRPMYYLR